MCWWIQTCAVFRATEAKHLAEDSASHRGCCGGLRSSWPPRADGGPFSVGYLPGRTVGRNCRRLAGGATIVATLIVVISVVISFGLLIFGIIGVGTLHRLAHLPESERARAPKVAAALLSAMRALPSLVSTFLLTIVALLAVTILALPVTMVLVIVAAAWLALPLRASAPGRPCRRTLPLPAAGGRVAMLLVIALIVDRVDCPCAQSRS